MDNDAANVFRFSEAHVRPRLSAIFRLVDAISPRRATLVIRLARADPYDVGIARRYGDIADRCGSLVIEDGLPGRSAVRRLPHAAGGRRHVEELAEKLPDLRLWPLGNRERYDAATRYGWADRAPWQFGETRRISIEYY